jgi:hypothetical protein
MSARNVESGSQRPAPLPAILSAKAPAVAEVRSAKAAGNRISTPVQTIFTGPPRQATALPYFYDPIFLTSSPKTIAHWRLCAFPPFASIRVNSSEFDSIRVNLTSRPPRGGRLPTPFLLIFCVLSRSLAALKRLVLGILRIFAAIQPNPLSMNHLHTKSTHLQPLPIVSNRA